MASIRRHVAIARPAADVWDALRDVGALHTRLVAGFVTDCRLEDDARIVTFANGITAKELILDIDDAQRRVAWSAVGGRLTHHNASAQVVPISADACEVVWIADLRPDALAPTIAGMIEQGLAAMKRTLEAAAPPADNDGEAHGDVTVRSVRDGDFEAWRPLWAGYNAFYGREGPTALPDDVTRTTWRRFLDPDDPMHALVAESHGELLGLAHVLDHRSTNRVEPVRYLQDLFTAPQARRRGVGRALIERVYADAQAAGIRRVYWHTHAGNAAARRLYDAVAEHAGFIVYAHAG